MVHPATHQTELSANIILFCRFLRSKGFTITSTDESEVLNALTILPINHEVYFKQALKAVLVKNRFQFLAFDDLYIEFWKQRSKAADSKLKQLPDTHKGDAQKQKQDHFESLKDWLNLREVDSDVGIATPSQIISLTKKNFNDFSEDEMELIVRLLKRLASQVTHQKSRLRKSSKKKKQVDLKRTIRYNMRRGGDIERMIYSEKKDKRLKIVLLCDVSKSMELYSRFFTYLLYAFQNAYDRIETFVFSTALHRVTDILNNLEFKKAFNVISDRVPHWSGGTTIGKCLEEFNNNFAYTMVHKKTIIIIVSDGWDSGDPIQLKEAMHQLNKKSKKIIWLNPLAGNPHYSPDALGMKTALPYISAMFSAHNLESLKRALKEINKAK